jgi:hypothetical protein
VLKTSQVISPIIVELNANISGISSVSIIRVDVMNDDALLMYISACQIDGSSYW